MQGIMGARNKFSSMRSHYIVKFDGLHITLKELRKQIMDQWRLKHCKLQITNEQSGEEYSDDEAHIPRLLSVIVRRIPLSGIIHAGRTFIGGGSETCLEGTSRPTDSSPSSLAQLTKVQDKSVEGLKKVSISEGIPRSFMVKAEPGTKGAMLTSTGEYVIPAINAEAYALFVPHDQSSSVDEYTIPDGLTCPICYELMTDAAIIACCGSSYCDECIRNALLDSKTFICVTCKQSDVSPCSLVANKCLRRAVEKFKCRTTRHVWCFLSRTVNTKRVRKPFQNAAPPPPRPQLVRPLHPRQQDPLLANVPHTSSRSVPPSIPQDAAAVEGQHASTAPPVVDHHSPLQSTSHGEPPPAGETDPEPSVRPDSSINSENGLQNYQFSVVGHPSTTRPPHSSGQSRYHHSSRGGGGGGGRYWERSFRSRAHPYSHQHAAQPPPPVAPVFPAPSLYPPPLQPYPRPYTTGPILAPPPAIRYQPQRVPPPHYTCHHCGVAGHYIRHCPMMVKISKGIPRSMMVKAYPWTTGVMITRRGEYAIPAINAEAYADQGMEHLPFVPLDK